MSHMHDNTPPYIAPQTFTDADAALAQYKRFTGNPLSICSMS